MKASTLCFFLCLAIALTCHAKSYQQADSLSYIYADKAEEFYPLELDSSRYYAERVLERLHLQEKPSSLEEEMLILLGRIHNQLGELDKSETYYTEGQDLSRNKGNFNVIASANYQLGLLSRKRNHYDQALKYFQNSLKTWKDLNNISEQAKVYNSMGILFRHWGKTDSSLKYLNLSIEKSKESGNQNTLANAFLSLGNLKAEQSQFDEAKRYYEQYQEIQKARNDSMALVLATTNLGNLYLEQGIYDQALNKYLENLRFLEANEITNESLGHVYNNIGNVYRRQNNFERALEYYDQALSVYNGINSIIGKADVMRNIGEVYNDWGKRDSALTYLELATNEYGQQNQLQKAGTLYLSGRIFYSSRDFEKAINYYSEAAEIYEDYNDDRNLALIYNGIGVCHFFLENYDTAYEYYQRAYEKSLASNYLQLKKNTLFNMYEIYEMRGEYEQALETYLLYTEKKDSLMNEQQTRDIMELTTKYETEKKDAEISLLQAEQERNEALIETRTAQRSSLFFGVIALLILLIAIAWWFIYKIRKEKIIAAQNQQIFQQEIDSLMEQQQLESVQAMLEGQDKERKRLAAELHDRLGSLLSLVKLYFSSMDKNIKESKPELYRSFQDGKDILDDTFREVREIIKEMNDSKVSGQGLENDIHGLLQKIDKFGINIQSNIQLSGSYPDSVELNLYRIIQEALSNALKYSRADTIHLMVSDVGNELHVEIKDNGQGFEPSSVNSGNQTDKSYGLENMKNRAKLINGSFSLQTKPEQGVKIAITVPKQEAEEPILTTEQSHD
ncbi:tetratricopeptide repeat protein [Gracilimonas mengyeensis]|uniref:Signal transduction histidine kinase n=1 Tax=Gracilimonas mengyeensis TaxID=1302730 RepID=A0A521EDV7_9BACT|nr:tetratricopeptide repeat protein [Gracilimonas mengyeensis]SMO82116.1 Signal transduction histidine kinase [Gracilimonas mengyeensis]